MSNQHKATANPPWIAKKVWMLPTALVVALVALVGLVNLPTFAQSNIDLTFTKTTDTPEVLQGGKARFTIRVTNFSAIGLKNVAVTDSCDVGPTRTSGDVDNDNILDSGETWTYTCEVNNVQATFDNVARLNAVTDNTQQNPVAATASSPVTVLNPGVHLTKSPRYPVGRDYFIQGDTVEFNVGIRNTGDFDIKQADITFTDLLCNPVVDPKTQAPVSTIPASNTTNDATEIEAGRDGAGNPAQLLGETWQYICRIPNASSNVTNQAAVTVKDVFGRTYTHSAIATAKVVSQGLAITKEPNKPSVTTSEVMTWTIKVYNTGNVNLGAPTVTDPLLTAQCPPWTKFVEGGDSDGQLEPGEVWTYACRIPAGTYPVGTTNNIATVTSGGLTASTTAAVEIIDPAFSFIATPPIQYVMKGQNATLTYKVTNTGSGAISQVQVADPQCTSFTGPTGDTNGNNQIDPNNPATAANDPETWSYSCTIVNLQQNLDTQGTFQGVAAGNTIPNPAPARTNAKIIVINNGVNMKKTADPVIYGGTATFRIEVTNNGNAELAKNDTNVNPYPMPVDPNCDAGTLALVDADLVTAGLQTPGDRDNAIDPGEVWVYTCTKANVTKEFDNTASISLKDPAGNVVSASSTVTVKVLTPGLSLQKLPAYQLVEIGTFGSKTVEWTLRLHNTGPSNLTPSAPPVGGLGGTGLQDALCATLVKQPDAPGNNDLTLNPGEVWVYKCSMTVFPWSAPLIVNFADANFTDGINRLYTSATARAQLVSTEINLSKTADASIILPGQPVKFTFEVGNPGFDDLTNVDLVDAMCPGGKPTRINGDVNGDNKLNVTERWVYQCTVTGQQQDFTNVATVTANGPSGVVQRSTATATVRVINAKLDVTKTANPSTVNQGGTVNFTIEVKNTGTQQLKDVVLVDDKCTLSARTGDTNGNNLLDTNETWVYTCSVANVQDSFRNSVTVNAKENSSNLIVTGSASADVTVTRPGINLLKTANQPSVQQGGTAYFTVIVGNAGTTNLTGVVPNDAFCPLIPIILGNGDAILNVGEIWIYSCAVPNVQGTNGVFVNTATVSASAGSIPVSAQGQASVSVTTPNNASIDVQKTGPASATAGSSVTFQVNVVNNGNVALTSVNVTDPLCTLTPVSLGNGDTTLDVGETWSYTCTVNNVAAGTLTNTASATAQGPAGQVSDSATATVTVTGGSGSLVLSQTVNPTTIVKGGSATFQATLANGTANNMTGVSLKGDKCKSFTRLADNPGNNDAVLNSGETWVWQCVLTKVTKTTTNKVTAKITLPKQTLTASIKLTVTSSRGLLVEEDVNEVSGVEVLIDGEGKVIDEAQLINKNYLPIVIGEEE